MSKQTDQVAHPRVGRAEARWGHAIELDPAPDAQPLYVQIAEAVTADVRRGVLRPGDALPGSRSLALALGVHRNTILAAFRELEKQGFLSTEAARGTRISESLPDLPLEPTSHTRGAAAFPVPRAPTFRVMATPVGHYTLLGGIPDLRQVPTTALARAYRRALRRPAVLGYGDPAGSRALRVGLAAMLARTRGLALTEDDVVVTRGSQMALDLIARSLLRPGDIVAVEGLGYRPAWEALRAAGARVVSVPVDNDGLVVERLEALAERLPLRAVYLTPHHQYPTTTVLPAPRRLALLALARKQRFAVIEDDFDHEFHYEGRPILPLAARAPESVVYIGTFSKVLAPGLRVGWVVAPSPLREAIVARRSVLDRQGDLALEEAVAELLEDGEITRHILRMRGVYEERRDVMVRLLTEAFGDTLHFRMPRGGMALWARVTGTDVDEWAAAAAAKKVLVQPAKLFTFDRRARPFLRLGYGAHDPQELRRAVALMASARPR
jgi:GntR family transcriptional regulator/MocR family aminotransferase